MILVILTLMLLAFGGYLGFRRGFQKSVIRMITLFAVLTIAFFLIPFFAEQTLLSLAQQINPSTRPFDQLDLFIQKQLCSYFSLESAALLSKPIKGTLLSASIPCLITVCYLPLLILSWIIYLTIIAALPPAKRRLWKKSRKKTITKLSGSVIGIVLGLLSSMILLLPLIVSNKITEQTSKNLWSNAPSSLKKIAVCYTNSPLSQVYHAIGLEQLALDLNQFHSVITVDSQTYFNETDVPIWLSELNVLSDMKNYLTQKENKFPFASLHSAIDQFYEFPYFKDQEKLLILNDVKYLLLNFFHGTGGIAEKFLRQMEYNDLALLKKDTKIYFKLSESLVSPDLTQTLLSNSTTAKEIAKQICGLSNAPVLLPIWINYVAQELTNDKIPKLIDGETFRSELNQLEMDSVPVFQNQSKTQKNNTSQTFMIEDLYESYLQPLLDLLYQIQLPDTKDFSSFRKTVFDSLAKLKKNPLIEIWNYTALHNYSRAKLSRIPSEDFSEKE